MASSAPIIAAHPVEFMNKTVDCQDYFSGIGTFRIHPDIFLKGGQCMAGVQLAAHLLTFGQVDAPQNLPGAYRAFQHFIGFLGFAFDDGRLPGIGTPFAFHPAKERFREFKDAFAAQIEIHADLINEFVIVEACGIVQIEFPDFL
jgi:hypothetical protein